MVSSGMVHWFVFLFPHSFAWLPVPGLWAVLYFALLCPGCGLLLSLIGMLDYSVCGVWLLCGSLILDWCGSFGGSVSG